MKRKLLIGVMVLSAIFLTHKLTEYNIYRNQLIEENSPEVYELMNIEAGLNNEIEGFAQFALYNK